MNLQREFNLEADRYVIQAEVKQRKKLNRQRKKILSVIMKVEKKIKAVKFKDSEYSAKLKLIEKMKTYVEKYAFLPRSYKRMLIEWTGKELDF